MVDKPPSTYNIQGKLTFFVFWDKGYMSPFSYSTNLESFLINELLLNCFLCMFLQKSNYNSIIGGSELESEEMLA